LRKTTNSDFRYYMHDGTTAFSFELAGTLSEDSARELQQAWRTALSRIDGRSLIVDLSYVTSIDVAGQRLLRGWHDRGAQFVAKSLEAKALIQSITGQSVGDLVANARHPTWLPVPRAALCRGRS
jgi:ABC-type transporter Mla MlaB component